VLALVTVGVLLYLLWLGWPSLLPVGTTVDAVHQYGLAQYIRDSGKLPIHATELRANLQDGLEYPPAFVTLVALLAGLLRADVVYLLYPVAALCVALSCGATFALASLLLKGQPWRLILAGLAAAFTLIPYGYTIESITSQNYFAMVLGQLLLLFALYFLLNWQQRTAPSSAFYFALTLAALLIDYPTWALIPAAAFGVVVLFQKNLRWRNRLIYLAAVGLPVLLLALLFLKDRLSVGLGTVANEGDVLLPDLGRYSWPVVILAAFGLFIALSKRATQPLALYAGLLASEGLGFYLLKSLFGSGSYYSVYKLFYPAVFLLALLAVIGLDWLLQLLIKPTSETRNKVTPLFLAQCILGLLVLSLTISGLWSHTQRDFSVLTPDMVKVGQWGEAKLKLDPYAVAYNLPPGTSVYWMQVGFFKQPQGNRAKLLLISDPTTFPQWFYNPESEKYFLTDKLSQVNLDERMSLLYHSGDTGILTRTPAYTDQRAKRQSMTMDYKAELDAGQINLTAEATFSEDPRRWMSLGLNIEPEEGGPAIFEQRTPPETTRERKQYMGIHVLLPSLKTTELYTNGYFPPVKPYNPLQPGKYTAYIELYKNETVVEKRKLFTFEYQSEKKIVFDPAQRIQPGQFLFDGPLSPDVSLPATRLDFGPVAPKLAGYELKGEAKAGSVAQLTLQWFNPPDVTKNYRIILALFDRAGNKQLEIETLPLNGLFPTWFWPANQPVTYIQNLKLPDVTGDYTLGVALLDSSTNHRTGFQKLDKPLAVR
jgi:hypothetical protein